MLLALPLETDRLLLRPFTLEDRTDLLAYASREEVTRYLYEQPASEADIDEWLARRMARTTIERPGDRLSLAVVPTEVGRVVGDVILSWTSQEEHRQGEVGFVMHPDHHGRGYATEATRPLLALAFDGLGLHRVVGRLDARNTASARVLERLGMRQEAHLVENEHVKGEWTDELVYAVLDREWRSGRPTGS